MTTNAFIRAQCRSPCEETLMFWKRGGMKEEKEERMGIGGMEWGGGAHGENKLGEGV